MEQNSSENLNTGSGLSTDTKSSIPKLILISLSLLFLVGYLTSVYWSIEPDPIDVNKDSAWINNADGKQKITGYTLVSTLADVTEILLEKPWCFYFKTRCCTGGLFC